MSIERFLARADSGSRITIISLCVGVAGAAPLLLYVAFGPEDGNPIGLGLLFIVVTPVAAIGACVGLILMAATRLTRRGR